MKRFKGVKISGVIKDSFEKKYQNALEIHVTQYIMRNKRFNQMKILWKSKDLLCIKYHKRIRDS